jgi:hypothetical protein
VCNQRAGSNHRALSYEDTAHDDGAASDRRASFDDRRFQAPLTIRHWEAASPSGPRATIVDEDDAVTYEDIVFYLDARTNEAVARYLAALADPRAPLNFDKSSDACVVADLATVEIDERAQAHSSP